MGELTRTQADALRRVRDRGPTAWCAGKGRGGGAVSRMFGRMRGLGFIIGPPYALTTYGARELRKYDEKRKPKP